MNTNNTNLDTYIIYDDSKTIEYLNLNNDVIGIEKNKKHTKRNTKYDTITKTMKNKNIK